MKMIPVADEIARALLSPDWQLVEKHHGIAVPDFLKIFYDDPDRVLQCDFDLETPKVVEGFNRIHVHTFTPIDEYSVKAFPEFEHILEIASDGGEGLYFFDPKDQNPEVYLFVMDGSELYPTGLSLRQFLEGSRLEPNNPASLD